MSVADPNILRQNHGNLSDAEYQQWLQYYQAGIGSGSSPEVAAEQANNNLDYWRNDQAGRDPFTGPDAGAPAAPTGGGGTNTASTPTEPNYVFFNGQQYDLNNPGQANAYYAAVRDDYIGQTTTDYQRNLGTLDQDVSALELARRNYGKDSAQQVIDLGQGYDLGTVKRGQYFATLSPNAYQSSQGSSQLFASDKLKEGIGGVQTNQAEAKTEFDRQNTDLGNERNALQTAYNDSLQSAADYYNTQGANAFNPMTYQADPNFKPFTPKMLDASGITPYTTFDNSQAGGGAPAGGNGFTPGSFDWLGYTPSETEKNYLERYLSGKY